MFCFLFLSERTTGSTHIETLVIEPDVVVPIITPGHPVIFNCPPLGILLPLTLKL